MIEPPGPSSGTDAVPAGGPVRHVSPAGYWIGSAIIVLGIVGAVVLFVVSIVALARVPSDYERFAVPSRSVTTLDSGSFDVFYERPGISQYGVYVDPPAVSVEDSSGASVPIGVSSRSQTYKIGEHEGRSIGTFTITRAGAYTVIVRGEPDSNARIAFGRGLGFRDFAGLVGASVLGAISLLVGILFLVVTAVRRSKARRTGPGAGAGPRRPGQPTPGAWSPPPPPPPGPGWGVSSPGADWGPPSTGAWPPPPASGWSVPGSDHPGGPEPGPRPGGAG